MCLLLTELQTSQTSNTSILSPRQGGAEKSLQLTSWIRPTVTFGFCFYVAVRFQSVYVIGSVTQDTQWHVSTENRGSMYWPTFFSHPFIRICFYLFDLWKIRISFMICSEAKKINIMNLLLKTLFWGFFSSLCICFCANSKKAANAWLGLVFWHSVNLSS